MTGFRRLARRRERIEWAAIASEDQRAVDAERQLYAPTDWTMRDDTVEAAALGELWNPATILFPPPADPVPESWERMQLRAPEVRAALAALPQGAGLPPPSFGADVLTALAGRTELYDELVEGAHRDWLLQPSAARRYPFADIGVMVPLGLETLFEQTGDGWQVRLRVIPQPPSIDAFSPWIPPGELRAAAEFWRRCGTADPTEPSWWDEPEVVDAFADLATSVGPARAAWLCAATHPVVGADGVTAEPNDAVAEPDSTVLSRVVGLPPRLSVVCWTYDGAGDEVPLDLGTLPQVPGRPDAEIAASIDVTVFTAADRVSENWLVGWDAAVDVGLAGTFALPDGLGPEGLGGIAVAGLGETSPAELVADQIRNGLLAEVALGAATASVGGATTALSETERSGETAQDGAPGADGFRVAAAARMTGADADPGSVDAVLRTYVAGADLPVLARPAGAAAREAAESMVGPAADGIGPTDVAAATGLSRLMVRALWPVLWGSALFEQWGMTDRGPALARWALDHLHPEGPLPPVRVDEQPYALLPATVLRDWVPGDEVASPDVVHELAAILAEVQTGLARAQRPLGSVRTVTGEVVEPRRYRELLGRGGASIAFRSRTYAASGMLPAAEQDRAREVLDRGLGALGLSSPADFWALATADARRVPLRLVEPRRGAAWGHRDRWVRVPLPHLVDIVLGRGRYTGLGPNPLPDSADDLFGRWMNPELLDPAASEWVHGEGQLLVLPNGLLTRLLLQSCFTANRWRATPPADLGGMIVPASWGGEDGAQDDQVIAAGRLAALADESRVELWEGGATIPGTDVADFPAVQDPRRARRLARALGATIDTVSHRIDALTGTFAWQRLRASAEGGGAHHRLGAYGWVHGPFLGTPGPTPSGRLHTPSLGQTVTAAILRDRHVTAARDGLAAEGGGGLWDMNLTSTTVRIADELADAVRAGQHLWEVVGGEVERIVGGADAAAGVPSPYLRVSALRRDYPVHGDRPSPHRVCDGLSALAGLVARDGAGGWWGVDARHPLSDAQAAALGDLTGSLDALADLTVIDGLTHAQRRETGRVAAVMDASAGLGRMPELDYPRTPPSGFLVRSTVLSVIPAADAGPDASPARIAEPSVAAFLDDRFGPDGAWRVSFEDGHDVEVTLAQLGLAPIDTFALAARQLERLVRVVAGERPVTVTEGVNRAWRVTVDGADEGTHSVAGLGLDPDVLAAVDDVTAVDALVAAALPGGAVAAGSVALEIVPLGDPRLWTVRDAVGGFVAVAGPADLGDAAAAGTSPDAVAAEVRRRAGVPAVAGVTAPDELAAVARLCGVLGTPAAPRDLARAGAVPSNGPAFEELRARYAALWQSLGAAEATLAAAATAGPDAQRAALRTALRWGVTPDASPADAAAFTAAIAGVDAPAGATPLATLVADAAAVLAARREGAPDPPSLPDEAAMRKPLPDPLGARAEGVPDGVASLARLVSQLAAPQGALPILVTWDPVVLAEVSGVTEEPRDELDEEWLTVVAAVRQPLARLEAQQLGEHPFTGWANARDPWLTERIEAIAAARGQVSTAKLDPPSFVAAYGPLGVWAQARVAVGVIDAFAEAVPLRERDTAAAFGFNAPAAKAPQAIVLAVPPVAGTRLDEALVHRILQDVRESMIARTATVDDLGPFDRVLRSVWLPASSGDGILTSPAYQAGS